MEQQWTNPTDGQVYRVGTAVDAGQLCRTKRAPKGITGHQYRLLVRKPSQSYPGAPGPICYLDPVWQRERTLTDPDTAEMLYDLDAVARWHDGRPGSGWRRGRREESAAADDVDHAARLTSVG